MQCSLKVYGENSPPSGTLRLIYPASEVEDSSGCFDQVLVAESFFSFEPPDLQRAFYETQAVLLRLTVFSIIDESGLPPEFLCRDQW